MTFFLIAFLTASVVKADSAFQPPSCEVTFDWPEATKPPEVGEQGNVSGRATLTSTEKLWLFTRKKGKALWRPSPTEYEPALVKWKAPSVKFDQANPGELIEIRIMIVDTHWHGVLTNRVRTEMTPNEGISLDDIQSPCSKTRLVMRTLQAGK